MTNSTKKVMTPVFRASFVNVFTPRMNDQTGKNEYSLKMIFEKDEDFSALQDVVKEAIRNKWGTNPPKGLKSPLKDGNESDVEKYPEDKNKIIANAKSTLCPPGLIDIKDKQPIIDPKEFYSGCYAIATVTAYAYNKNGNRGVAFGLQNICKMKDGEPLVSRATAEDDFASVAATESDASSSDILGDLT